MAVKQKILVTGSNGFLGKNLCLKLAQLKDVEILSYDLENTRCDLEHYAACADFVFHLAGINRPDNDEDFKTGNTDFTKELISLLEQSGREPSVVFSSSIQAELDNPYGMSKKYAEDQVFAYGEKTGSAVYVYRLPNLFGKWCRPNYNSVIATFCYNIAHGLDIRVNDPSVVLRLSYIDDVVDEFTGALSGCVNKEGQYCVVPDEYQIALGIIPELLKEFRCSRENLGIPDMKDAFVRKLYSTYLSYLPEDNFSYPLKMNKDVRGSFSEFLKSEDRGQVSVNVSRPGVIKGNHWHHTKNEKFLVVSGKGIIRFRRVGGDEVLSYAVSGEKLEVVDIPPGYTHNLENNGDTDMVTIIWVNEIFDPQNPDTFYEEV